MDHAAFRVKFFKLVSELLSLAETEFSHHGCNDLDRGMICDWTDEERQHMARLYHQFNEDRLDPVNNDGNLSLIPNYALMGFMAAYFKDNAEVLGKNISIKKM